MSINDLKQKLPEYAKDIKLNLGNVMLEKGSPGLTLSQIYLIALASAFTTKHAEIIDCLIKEAGDKLSTTDINAAKVASIIMAMNNIYYRFVHLVSDEDYRQMPSKLRMNMITNTGVEKIDFELMSLAVSAINGCGLCMDSHVKAISDNVSKEGIQSTIRIASVINAVASTLAIN